MLQEVNYIPNYYLIESQGSSVNIWTWLCTGRAVNEGSVPEKSRDLPVAQSVQTGSGAQPASYQIRKRDFFLGGEGSQ